MDTLDKNTDIRKIDENIKNRIKKIKRYLKTGRKPRAEPKPRYKA